MLTPLNNVFTLESRVHPFTLSGMKKLSEKPLRHIGVQK